VKVELAPEMGEAGQSPRRNREEQLVILPTVEGEALRVFPEQADGRGKGEPVQVDVGPGAAFLAEVEEVDGEAVARIDVAFAALRRRGPGPRRAEATVEKRPDKRICPLVLARP
jgi:hypothetical protein